MQPRKPGKRRKPRRRVCHDRRAQPEARTSAHGCMTCYLKTMKLLRRFRAGEQSGAGQQPHDLDVRFRN